MRQAADILSSAPAMQIRYLEAMQAMAKSANSKVIFLPGANSNSLNAAMAAQPNNAEPASGSGPSHIDFGSQDPGFQHAISARIAENI